MSNKILCGLISLVILSNFACQSSEPAKTNTNTTNTAVTVDPKNMPAGLSTSPVPPSGNSTPGIPDMKNANAAVLPKGATPTPGIPADPSKPLPKGATPTPGIPDPATLKKQLNTPVSNVNATNPAASTSESGGDDRPRTVRKP